MRFWSGARSAILAVLLLAGCSRDGEVASTAGADQDVIAQHIASPPWLRDRLPVDTIGYVRLPSPWGLLAAPNGKAPDAMFASQAHVDAIAALRAGFAANPILAKVLGTDAADDVIRALNAVAGPIELAIVSPGKIATPAAQALISTSLTTRDPAVAAAHLAALSADTSIAFDKDGFAALTMGDAPVFAHFDAGSGRLHLLTGASAQAAQLPQLLSGMETDDGKEHASRALEREIDASGQGVVVWVDAQSIKPWLMTTLTDDTLWMRHVFEQTQAIGYGWGGVDGHGRLTLRLQLKDPTWLRYLPQAGQHFDLRSVGDPGFVLTMALPVAADVERMLAAVQADHGAPAAEAWSTIDTAVLKETGLGLRDWLKPFGPELIAFNDDPACSARSGFMIGPPGKRCRTQSLARAGRS